MEVSREHEAALHNAATHCAQSAHSYGPRPLTSLTPLSYARALTRIFSPLPSPSSAGRMLFPLVRGSPFITGIYSGLCPALYTGHAILKVNDADVPNAAATGPSSSSSSSGAKCEPLTRHHVVLNSGATVLVYLDRPACAKWDRNRIIFDDPRLNTCAGSDWSQTTRCNAVRARNARGRRIRIG